MSDTDLIIRELGPKGDGIHFGTRGRVYVERSVPGDRLRGRVHRDEQGVARAQIVSLIEPSPLRQQPPCPHYQTCGNCSLQHITPRFYREWKDALVREAFEKQGLRPRQWLGTVFVGEARRRRATFAVFRDRQRVGIGYYRRRSQEIAEIDSCLVVTSELMAVRDAVRRFLVSLLSDGATADCFIQMVGGAADVVFTGPMGKHGEPDETVRRAILGLMDAAPVNRVSWRATDEDPIEPLLTQGTIEAVFGSLRVGLPPAAFLQPTLEGEKALSDAVLAALPSGGVFADLFSGCGTFTGPMLGRGPVEAFESAPQAVQALTRASRGHALKVFRRDLFRHPLRRDELNRYDAVVFDPPRAGCPEQAAEMAVAKTGVLVGVSCNPATFARDSRILCDGGYWLQSLQIVDQFVWSHHVEVIGVFTKRKRAKNASRRSHT